MLRRVVGSTKGADKKEPYKHVAVLHELPGIHSGAIDNVSLGYSVSLSPHFVPLTVEAYFMF